MNLEDVDLEIDYIYCGMEKIKELYRFVKQQSFIY